MFWTSAGERILIGAEAKLFRYGLLRAVDELTLPGGDTELGIGSFDRMTLGQRLTGLYTAASALLDEQAPVLKLTQPIEASVAAVYNVIAVDAAIEAEYDDPGLAAIRTLIAEAMREANFEEVPDPQCSDPGEWQLSVDCLRDLVQFDDDFEDFDDLTDQPPEVKAAAESFLGIDPEYFSHILDDPPDGEIPALVKKLQRLGK
jgi:hypothetical protein